MITTGWIAEPPEPGSPAMPLTQRALRARQQVPGGVVGQALARAAAAEAREERERQATAPDPDEYAANLVSRGYLPGTISTLAGRLAETEAELADEQSKLEKAAKRAERTRRMHERGQIDAAGVAARWQDTDEGDEAKVERLQRRAESLRRQIVEASEAMAPRQAREHDAVEAASAQARQVLQDVARMAAEEAAARHRARAQLASERRAFYAARGRLPFASRSDAAVECADCRDCGFGPEESAALHAEITAEETGRSGELNVYQMPPGGWEAVRAGDERDGVIRRSVEGAVVGLR